MFVIPWGGVKLSVCVKWNRFGKRCLALSAWRAKFVGWVKISVCVKWKGERDKRDHTIDQLLHILLLIGTREIRKSKTSQEQDYQGQWLSIITINHHYQSSLSIITTNQGPLPGRRMSWDIDHPFRVQWAPTSALWVICLFPGKDFRFMLPAVPEKFSRESTCLDLNTYFRVQLSIISPGQMLPSLRRIPGL